MGKGYDTLFLWCSTFCITRWVGWKNRMRTLSYIIAPLKWLLVALYNADFLLSSYHQFTQHIFISFHDCFTIVTIHQKWIFLFRWKMSLVLMGGTQIISSYLKSWFVTEIMKLEVLFLWSFVDQSIVHNSTYYMYLCIYCYMWFYREVYCFCDYIIYMLLIFFIKPSFLQSPSSRAKVYYIIKL